MSGPDSVKQLIGTTLCDGRYVISGVLGEGSQGATLDAIDKRDGTRVAIKRFMVRGARSWKDVELAEREARVLTRLTHDLLPSAITHFEEEGILYLVMERIEGQTLAQLGRLPRPDVIRFLHDADRVLTYLHNQSPPLVHRDIKPSNVIQRPSVDGSKNYVLVDFGSVSDKLRSQGGSTVVGTYGFMAPEQFQGRARPQSDVYAVGATALALLTGEQPEDLPHKGLAIDVRAALPHDPGLANVLSRMVEPDPDVRPVHIGPLLKALDAQTRARPAREGREPSPQPLQKNEPTSKASRKERRRQEKALKRQERRARKMRHPSNREPVRLPPVVLRVVVVAMALARVVVGVTLRALVPSVLTLLSIIFGKPLRNAAKAVGQAAVAADAAMLDASRWVTGQSSSRASTYRIAIPESDAKAIRRVADRADVEVDAAIEEAAAMAEALSEMPGKKRRRPRDD